jgi:hypothetical protein
MISEDAIQQILESLPTPKKRVRLPKPKLVTDQGRIVGTATVYLSPGDPNWHGSNSVYVKVLDRLEDDGPNVISSYDPFEFRGPRYHG